MKKSFGPSWIYLVPSVVIGLVSVVLLLFLTAKSKTAGLLFFGLIFLPLVFILAFVNLRFLVFENDKICVRGLLGRKCVGADEIEKVSIEKVGMRNVLWIRAKSDQIIVPLVFSDLSGIKNAFKEAVGERLDESDWRRSITDIALLYLATVFLIFILLFKLI